MEAAANAAHVTFFLQFCVVELEKQWRCPLSPAPPPQAEVEGEVDAAYKFIIDRGGR